MVGEELQHYILNLEKEKRRQLLQEDWFRNQFLNKDNIADFIWLVDNLDDDLKYFLDLEYMQDIVNCPSALKQISAIAASGNKYVNNLLVADEVLEKMLSKPDHFNFSLLNYKVGQAIIDYDILNHTNNFYLLGTFKKDEQLKIFSPEYITKIIDAQISGYDLLHNLDGQIVSKFLKYDIYQKNFLNFKMETIDYMINYNNLVMPLYLYHNQTLINKYITLDANTYRKCVNDLKENNFEFYAIIENERKMYVAKEINKLDILEKKANEEQSPSDKLLYLLKASKDNYKVNKRLEKNIYEMVVEVLFKDIPYNFLANLRAVLDYYLKNKPKIKIDFDLYNGIINFNKLSLDDRKEFFYKYKDLDCASDFYRIFRSIRNHSYDDINNNLFKFDKCYNKEVSKKISHDTYYLDGDDFNLCIHATRLSFLKSKKDLWNSDANVISMSIIGFNNINYFRSDINNIIFGFNKLENDHIIHVSNTDSYSLEETGTIKIHSIYNTRDLINNTLGYNEIFYLEKNLKDFKPDFLVTYDKISDLQKAVADYYNLPIVVINTKKYKRKNDDNISSDDNNYLNYIEARNLDNYDEFETDFENRK